MEVRERVGLDLWSLIVERDPDQRDSQGHRRRRSSLRPVLRCHGASLMRQLIYYAPRDRVPDPDGVAALGVLEGYPGYLVRDDYTGGHQFGTQLAGFSTGPDQVHGAARASSPLSRKVHSIEGEYDVFTERCSSSFPRGCWFEPGERGKERRDAEAACEAEHRHGRAPEIVPTMDWVTNTQLHRTRDGTPAAVDLVRRAALFGSHGERLADV
jgi:hypothetical protein